MHLTVEVDREDHGRWIAGLPDWRSVIAYGRFPDEGMAYTRALSALSTRLFAMSTTVVLLVACSEPHDRGSTDTLHESKVSRGVQDAGTPARYVRSCPVVPLDPTLARAVFDLHLRTSDGASASSDSAARAIERAGGRVLHRFHVAAIRAELDTATVRALVYGPNWIAEMAEQVLDLRSFDIPVQVRYDRLAAPLDSSRIARLGGAASLMPVPRPLLNAVVPDSAMPELMSMPGVVSVRARSATCGDSGRE